MSTIEAGWRRAREISEVDPQSGEVEITECLREGMRRILSERTAIWCKRMTVLPGTESRSSPAATRPDGRTDIPIFFQEIRETHDDHDPHAIIECKRVAANDAALCRLYVVEGIDRYTSTKYAGRHTVAFMAGYVLSGSVGAVAHGINRYLSRHDRAAERLTSCTVVVAAWARSSRHPRPPPAAPIDLHHAFLTFKAVP
ncbi:MAG: hypothetical protein OXH96_07440 [Spirochaetaceae bacterium]|nr:hypothetical protein [Spirochaetaceae bacterium]